MSDFVMAGGGTGGHVLPAIAVARELRKRGHEVLFIGTRKGMEAKLVPAAGFPIEWIEIGGLKRVGTVQTLRSLWQLPASTARLAARFGKKRPGAVFSMGGYAAGPVMLAAWLRGVPMVLMEPNAIPGLTNRRMAGMVKRALVSFEETVKWFPPGKAVVTGAPVREEFFALPERRPGRELTVLITGGSRGSQSLNQAVRQSWPRLKASGLALRLIHQTGPQMQPELEREFAATGLKGEVRAFIEDMPAAFGQADIVVSRSGAGAVAELAAAGKPSILVPFPFAADDHQKKNAEVLVRAGAALLVEDRDLNGDVFFEKVAELAAKPDTLTEMGRKARSLAHPGAAARAADLLEEVARGPWPVVRSRNL